MSAPAPEAGPSGSGPVQAASQSDDVVVLSDVNMSSPPAPAKPAQGNLLFDKNQNSLQLDLHVQKWPAHFIKYVL